ncbi:hypothetical protein LTV02_17530 [Nocardia yamanashiensis]|uniref:hypothetical protein n=1 Tax=Nocardia yamanashiensis TaxID=209247 RepID=UPI001E508ED6|nr:hypothetical protein [Nocardia yamanashiensis]UGT45075.1 hypothetical protein LTV02_17530 [Nocardia yamanashiensis]
MDAERAVQAARDSQGGAEREQLRVSHGTVDADYVQRLEHFEGWSHEEIYAAVREMNPGEMHAAAEAWVSIGNNLSGAAPGLHIQLQNILTDGSAGHIAAAADRAAREFVQQVLDVAEIAHSTGHRMTAAAFGAEAVRKSVPPPPGTGATDADLSETSTTFLGLLLGTTAPGDAQQAETYREEQYRLALAALETNYVPTYPPAGAGVPAFADIEMPGAGAGSGQSGAGFGTPAGVFTGPDAAVRSDTPNAHEGSAASFRTPPESARPGSGSPVTANHGNATESGGAEDSAGSEQDSGSGTAAASTSSSTGDTSPAAANTERTGTPGISSPGAQIVPALSGSPGSRTSASAPAGNPGSLARPPGAAGAPGLSYPGAPTGKPSAPNQPATSARTPSPGAGYLPGMYAPGAASAANAEGSHKAPTWLTWHRDDELLGTPPPAVPPVLGSEIPSARTDLTSEEPETP